MMQEKEIKKEDSLQKQRRMLLEEFIQQIQHTIVERDIKGEDKRKIAIYSRLAEYTYYSEVSIRKFLTGMIPKDMETFVNGILAYGNDLKMDDNYLERFATEYTIAASAIILNKKLMNRTQHNFTLQNLQTIIRREKITKELDAFIQGDDTICYVYGYKLSGKTKSVLAYGYDLMQKKCPFEYLIWNDFITDQDIEKKVIQSTLKLVEQGSSLEQLDEVSQKELWKETMTEHKALYIIDLQGNTMKKDTLHFVKELAQYASVIVIAIEPYEVLSESLGEGSCSVSFNEGMTKEEVKDMINTQYSLQQLLATDPTLIDEIYQLTDGFPFATLYLCKRFIEENKYGKSIQEILTEYKTYYNQGYDFLNEKIIDEAWNQLAPLAKHILSLCSQYDYSLSLQCIASVCQIEMTQEAWKEALNSCYQSGLLNHVIGIHPRCKMNHLISTLIKSKNKGNAVVAEDFDNMVRYYIDMTANIGICYNDLDRMKRLDELEEYDVLQQVMKQLYQQKRYSPYIQIGVNIKYYMYVRGYWTIGENSTLLKRYLAAKEIQNPNEQLRALCEYINIMSKQRNEKEAKQYLKVAEEIVALHHEKLDPAIMVLYNHVNALYLYHSTKDYAQAWEFWERNEKQYQNDMSQYRKMVNTLWMDKCRYQLEQKVEKLYEKVKQDYEIAVRHHFTRGIIDYQLLLTNILFKQYKNEKQAFLLEEIADMLLQANIKLEKDSVFDIRNEAELYRQLTILYHYQKEEKKKEESFFKACERYKRLHATQSIVLLEQELKDLS